MVNSAKSKEERKAKAAQLAKKAQAKKRDWFKIGTIIGSLVLVGVVATTVIVLGNAEKEATSVEASTISPVNASSGGYTFNSAGIIEQEAYEFENYTPEASPYSSDETNITMYVDYACPACQAFDASNINQIQNWLETGTIDTLTVKPVVFLSDYSLFGANAVACVAETAPEALLNVHKMLLEEQSNAPSELDLIEKMNALGVPENDEFTKCVRGGKFNDYVAAASANAQTGPLPNSSVIGGVTGTPTILVNGEKYPGNPDPTVFAEFLSFVQNGGKAEDLQ